MSLTPRSSQSPHLLLPPIISNEQDRDFLIELNSSIDDELGKIDKTNPEQRYVVYKDAFDKIIDYVTAYKPLLTAIKAEYEDCIETIRRGQREAFFLSGKLKAMASEPSTIHNYRKRADELEHKMTIVHNDNQRLRQHLAEIRAARKEKEKEKTGKETKEAPKHKEVKKDNRHIPGLTLQQSTDIKILKKELEKLEKQHKELTTSQRTRYCPKNLTDTLKEHLSTKCTHRDELQELTEVLKLKRFKLKIAVEAAQAYMKIQPPNHTIGEAVIAALSRAGRQMADKGPDEGPRGTPSTMFEEDDPNKEKEAELMLEYIERFNELVEDHKYEEAAIHAANSPKGILRTPETLHRFKDLQHSVTPSGRSPLLAYCDALMSTVLAYGVRPSESMSKECVKCALQEHRLDLLSHWISQDRLTVTENLGRMVYEFSASHPQCTQSCLALAQKVFVDVEAHIPAMVCMVRQGRINQALDYGCRNKVSYRSYAAVLRECPSSQLAHGLYQSRTLAGNSLLPLGGVAWTLLQTDMFDIGLHLIHDVHQQHTDGDEGDVGCLRQAVFEDALTTHEQWLEVAQKLQENDYHDACIDVLAAVTVLSSVRNATKLVAEMDRKKEEEDKRKRQEEEEKKKKEKKKKKKKNRQKSVEDEIPKDEHETDEDHSDRNEYK